MIYEVRPVEKKNVYTTSYYTMPDDGPAAGKMFAIEEMYRWGRCTVETDEPITIQEDPYKIPFDFDDYIVLDQEMDDGCSLDFVFHGDWTDEEKEYIESIWDQESYSGFDEKGIYIDETESYFYGPLEITLIEDGNKEEDLPKTGGWPF